MEIHTKASQISNPLVKVWRDRGKWDENTFDFLFPFSPAENILLKKLLCAQFGFIKKARRHEKGWKGGGGLSCAPWVRLGRRERGRISCVCFWKGTLEGGLYLTQSRALRPIINSPRWRWSWTIGAFQWGRGAPVPDPSWPVLQPHCCPAVTSASWAERET